MNNIDKMLNGIIGKKKNSMKSPISGKMPKLNIPKIGMLKGSNMFKSNTPNKFGSINFNLNKPRLSPVVWNMASYKKRTGINPLRMSTGKLKMPSMFSPLGYTNSKKMSPIKTTRKEMANDAEDDKKLYFIWKKKADELAMKIRGMGYPVNTITVKSWGSNPDEIIEMMKQYYNSNYNYDIPIDIYASIPANSPIAAKISAIGENPKEWWLRWDNCASWEILLKGAESFQESNYKELVFKGRLDSGNINDVGPNNLPLAYIDDEM